MFFLFVSLLFIKSLLRLSKNGMDAKVMSRAIQEIFSKAMIFSKEWPNDGCFRRHWAKNWLASCDIIFSGKSMIFTTHDQKLIELTQYGEHECARN